MEYKDIEIGQDVIVTGSGYSSLRKKYDKVSGKVFDVADLGVPYPVTVQFADGEVDAFYPEDLVRLTASSISVKKRELKMKHRLGELTITLDDVIMDNGQCFQLMTQTYQKDYSEQFYVLSKTVCQKLIRNGTLVLVKTTTSFETLQLKYYKLAEE